MNHYFKVRIRILLSSSKIVRKNLIPTVLCPSFLLLSLKNYVNVNVNVISRKTLNFGVLKVIVENSMILIRIRIY
jgi:hypothetical protein